ncbi:glycosyl transferase, partial [Rhodobaculum claviforme]|nr:glycosyl transferase [Rhodobaculum claviforme]
MVMPQALRAALGWDTRAGRRSARVDLWRDTDVIRADLFGAERLEHHAISLARAQPVTSRRIRVMPLAARVDANADRLLAAYRACAQTVQARRSITPAAEWLLDNFHLIEQQVQQIRDDLPPGYYRQLPKLAEGPFAGYPRVLGIAWAYVAHGDSLLNPPVLARFVRAYQTVAPLTIGELWAVAITLRIVLIENARRLSDEIMAAHEQRAQADRVVDALLAPCTGDAPPPALRLAQAVAPLEGAPLPEILAARIAKRLRGCDPVRTPLCGWLDDRLAAQDITSDAVILRAQQRQGASNVTMRNIVTSMRLISEMDWQDLFEEVSPVDAQLRAGSDFAALDFATRNLYRTAIETLARGAAIPEAEVAAAALARAADGHDDTTRDPGHWLIGAGTATLERDIGHLPRPGARAMRIVARTGLAGYLGATAVAALAILALAAWVSGAQGWGAVALAVLGLGLALEAGVALVNLAVTRLVAPRRLPGLELADGIPPDLRCLVAVPVLLSSSAEVAEAIARLEVHHLSSTGGALHYALVSDGRDAATETEPQDAGLIAMATAAIARLNAAHPSQDGARFVFLHRRRQWNPSMGVWMGWERKRGKLAELNRLLRGATDTSFVAPATVPGGVRFVITLDADTRLLRDTVRRLIGKMAHPLNRPRLDPALGRVTRGHGILQPRVTPALAVGAEGSVFQRINAGHAGIDAYAAAISDVYQDLFDEGSFTGKGIYDVDAFAGALAGRVPENTMLSHDLFEGIFARAGLVSDIEVVEEFPTRHDVAARRQDRWVRGDWQLLPWLLGRRAMPGLGRWKITDNLRRSLTPPLTLAALATGWLMAPPLAAGWTLAVLGMLALPHLLPLPFVVLPGRAGITARSHVAALGADARAAVVQIVLGITFLPDTAFRMGDAIVRTAVRLAVSRRNLLAWITAAQSAQGARPGLWAQGRRMGWGVAL